MGHRLQRGLVHVYVGGGKGKTSAALGAALRAMGRGLRVAVVHFMKNLDSTGEHFALRSLPHPPPIHCFGLPPGPDGELRWIDVEHPRPEAFESARGARDEVRRLVTSGEYDLVIGDELLDAADWRLVPWEDILGIMRDKALHTELILTGHKADARAVEAADIVTRMEKVKHPYDQGMKARLGIEL